MIDIKSSSKKVLLVVALMVNILVGKVFAQSEYSGFFKKQYVSTTDVANDLAKGELALVNNMDTLRFINIQLDNWNTQLAVQKVKKDDGSIFQLQSNFGSMEQARPYFYKILHNHCANVRLKWNEGDFLISRVKKKTGEVSSFLRKSYDGEMVATLRTRTGFPEISDADGDAGKPDIYGFSLACGNELKPKKVEKTESVVFVKTEEKTNILSPGNEVTYKGITDGTTTTTTTGTGNTYNTYNTVNTPPPPPVDKHPNRGIWAGIGVSFLGTAVNFMMNLFMMRQMQRQTTPVYQSPAVYAYQPPITPVITPGTPIQGNTGTPGYNPIQGNTGGVVNYNPVQGATGGVVGYNPVQGVTNGVITYDPVQGATGQKWVYDPIQGWVFK